MSRRNKPPDDLIQYVIYGIIGLGFVGFLWLCCYQGMISEGIKQDKHQALLEWAIKTNGHLERYESGSHIESKYCGTIGSRKHQTTIYQPVEVKEYEWRISYPDKPPYYPQEHFDWLPEFERLQAKRKSKK